MGTTGELSPIPGYRMWNIDVVLLFACVCVFPTLCFFNLKLQKSYKVLQVISISPFPRFANYLHFVESFENKLETFCFLSLKHFRIYFRDSVLYKSGFLIVNFLPLIS